MWVPMLGREKVYCDATEGREPESDVPPWIC